MRGSAEETVCVAPLPGEKGVCPEAELFGACPASVFVGLCPAPADSLRVGPAGGKDPEEEVPLVCAVCPAGVFCAGVGVGAEGPAFCGAEEVGCFASVFAEGAEVGAVAAPSFFSDVFETGCEGGVTPCGFTGAGVCTAVADGGAAGAIVEVPLAPPLFCGGTFGALVG